MRKRLVSLLEENCLFMRNFNLSHAFSEICCPVCLDQCLGEKIEACGNGHIMHFECAAKMSRFMPLKCPLCRSPLICRICKVQKHNIFCHCSGQTCDPDNVWLMMKKVYATHFLVMLSILALPMLDAPVPLLFLMVNLVVMMRRIVRIQRKSDQVKSWDVISRFVLCLTQIGMDFICAMLLAAIGLLIWLYTRTWKNFHTPSGSL